MTKKTIIWGVMVLGCTVQAMSGPTEDNPPEYMSKEDREMLKEEARDMFYHAYNAYMDNAYPADELMPLSCKGRYRNSEADRGDIDSTLGNFSLTLVDTLDTLVVLGDLGEFENAVRLVVKDVTFDTDVIVSLFETNIRMLGGLLSGHILAEYLQSRADIMPWYRGELLNLAKDLGYRFLPAFNTTTGIPFGRINLRHGMKGVPAEMCRETCTACAGSMILEMAALSRLTGESIFEDKAQKAMDALWKMRHRGTDLMGSVLNVHSGDWVRRDSGVGAGIDSYYEYCLKAYILLGDEKYLGRFNKHYQAVMKYVSQGPMLLDVHMHRPNTNSKNFMDALLAFWPGLQVLKGDIKPAVETHEMLYQVMQRHNFIPEAFTTDFQVHWGHHPLRPEFLESTYFLYRATGDHYYLGVGRKVLKSLQTYARVPCGYAAVSDVRTNKHDDTMDSFVLSETLKYLYLLFAEPNDLVLDLDEFIFTTEGHLLPLTLAAVRTNVTAYLDRDVAHVDELGRTCPNSLHLFPASVRQPLRNMVEDVCPRRSLKRRLNASQFQANNLEHLKILSNMGITILTPAAGRVQVLHTFSNARTAQDAEEGLLFMQEMVELSKKQSEQSETKAQSVTFVRNDENPPRDVILLAGPAHFGPRMKDGKRVTGIIEYADPFGACEELLEPEKLAGRIVMVSRGDCMFIEKARRIQKAGAIAGIVLDNEPSSSAAESPMFAMSGDGKDPDDVTIPVVFLFTSEAAQLLIGNRAERPLTVTIGDYVPREEIQLNAPGDLSVFERLKGSLKDFLSRQVTPQNSATRTTDTLATTEIFSVTDGYLPIEYTMIDFHLNFMIFTNTGNVKIVKTGSSPPKLPAYPPIFLNNFEKAWHAIKQDLVDDIYSSKDENFVIKLAKIQIQYKIVNKLRGYEISGPVEKIANDILMEWFLRELSDVSPGASRHSTNENSNEKISEGSWEKWFDRASRGDVDIIREISDATKNLYFAKSNEEKKKEKEEKKKEEEELKDCSEGCSTIGVLDDVFERLNFNGKSRDAVVQELVEALERNFYSEFVEFKFYLTADIAKKKSNRDSVDSRNNGNIIIDNELSTMITHDKFIGYLYRKEGLVKIKIMENFESLPIVETRESSRLEGFERTWHELRQFLINVIHSYDDKTVTLTVQSLEVHYHTVQALRAFYNAHAVSHEQMIVWYLTELGNVSPEPDVIDNLYMRRTGRKAGVKLSLNTEELLYRLLEHETTKNSQSLRDVTRENLEKSETSSCPDGKIDSNDGDEISDEKRIERLARWLEKNDETRIKLGSIEIEGGKFGKNVQHASSDDDSSSFSVIMKNEENMRESVDDEIESGGDSMEEFKKPVWATDDGKDENFLRLQEKTEFSDDNYEYTRRSNNERTKTRQDGKRIEDEL